MIPDTLKKCAACRQLLDQVAFYPDKRRSDGFRPYCRDCEKAKKAAAKAKVGEESKIYANSYYHKNKAKINADRITRQYGLLPGEYERTLEAQNGACAICRRIPGPEEKALGVDHVHDETKRVRALLCQPCNLLLGNCREDIRILDNAKEYLLRHGNPVLNLPDGEAMRRD